mgnify:CR=1 FL=1
MSAVTSKLNPIQIGKGKNKKTIYTGTQITPTTDLDGNKTYKVEIVQYDNENGDGGRVIGERSSSQPSTIDWNDNAGADITGDPEALKAIKSASKTQANSIEEQLVTNSAESREYNRSNGNGNKGNESENNQDSPKLTNIDDATNIINGAAGKSAIGTREKGFGAYVFPASLRQGGGGQDFLKFDMMKYEPRSFDKKTFAFKERSTDTDKRSIGSVILPIPSGIQDSTSVRFGDGSMSPLDMAKANVALTAVQDLGEGVSEVGNQARKIADAFGDTKGALAAVIAGMASGSQELLTRTTGAIANPNMELLFGGPNLRSFSFQFLLAPRDKDEAMTVIQILRFFKQGMSPIRTKSRLFMKSPHTFQLSYRNSQGKQHKYLNKFKECALSSFGVDYAPNGNYSTYEDGVMTAYRMTMTYSELNPIYNDDYGNDNENGKLPTAIGF